jgi:hypothetical protein
MPASKKYRENLINCYLNNECSPEELLKLYDILKVSDSDRILLKQIKSSFDRAMLEPTEKDLPAWSERVRELITIETQQSLKSARFYKIWLPRVAASIIVVSFCLFLSQMKTKSPIYSPVLAVKTSSPVKVLTGKVLLTLSDGSVIPLDDTQNGKIGNQDGTIINKNNGEVIYNAASNSTRSATNISFNTITTPKGGKYQIILPDGSKVWLNSEASLHFPTDFRGDKRVVELTGEGYFEIEKNPKMPFFVKLNQMEIEVLGTHFNIMAYDNEASTKTTLLEGAIKMNFHGGSKNLKPGEQAEFKHNSQNVIISKVDAEEAIAWKNGYFEFSNEDIKSIMRKLARRYDIDVVFEQSKQNRYFTGEIPMDLTLPQAMNILNHAGIKSKIDGKKILINK